MVLLTLNISYMPNTETIPGSRHQVCWLLLRRAVRPHFDRLSCTWTAVHCYPCCLSFRAGDRGRCCCMAVVQGHRAHLAVRGMSTCSNRPLLCWQPWPSDRQPPGVTAGRSQVSQVNNYSTNTKSSHWIGLHLQTLNLPLSLCRCGWLLCTPLHMTEPWHIQVPVAGRRPMLSHSGSGGLYKVYSSL